MMITEMNTLYAKAECHQQGGNRLDLSNLQHTMTNSTMIKWSELKTNKEQAFTEGLHRVLGLENIKNVFLNCLKESRNEYQGKEIVNKV